MKWASEMGKENLLKLFFLSNRTYHSRFLGLFWKGRPFFSESVIFKTVQNIQGTPDALFFMIFSKGCCSNKFWILIILWMSVVSSWAHSLEISCWCVLLDILSEMCSTLIWLKFGSFYKWDWIRILETMYQKLLLACTQEDVDRFYSNCMGTSIILYTMLGTSLMTLSFPRGKSSKKGLLLTLMYSERP